MSGDDREKSLEFRQVLALERIAAALETPASILVASLQDKLQAIPKWTYTLDTFTDSRGRRTVTLNVTEES